MRKVIKGKISDEDPDLDPTCTVITDPDPDLDGQKFSDPGGSGTGSSKLK